MGAWLELEIVAIGGFDNGGLVGPVFFVLCILLVREWYG